MNKDTTFGWECYPVLYQVADSFSIKAQNRFLGLFRWEQMVLLAGAMVSLFPLDYPRYGQLLAALSALFFIAAIIITVATKILGYEEQWYIGRSIAESIKTLSWRFILNGEPFGVSKKMDEATANFCAILKEIYSENGSSIGLSLKERETSFQPTQKMLTIRMSHFEERKQLYIENRIKSQLNWYNEKTASNKIKETQFFYILILCQSLAVLYSIYLIKNPNFFNGVPLLTAAASSLISWTKVKQFKEVAQAYATTAQEISAVLIQSDFVKNEQSFSVYISDSENAFSREHTLWLARKDVFNYLSK